jgi:hypothetical protein
MTLLKLEYKVIADQLDGPPELLHILNTVFKQSHIPFDPFLLLLLKELVRAGLSLYFVTEPLYIDGLLSKFLEPVLKDLI